MTVLVAGGTGRLGTRVVTKLLSRGTEVRVLTRDPARAGHLGSDVEVVVGDVRDAAAVHGALNGVATVVSAVHGFAGPGRVSPKAIDQRGNAHLISAAHAAGADIVLVSIVGASPDSPMELFRCKYAAEQMVRTSGAPWTIVRATAFVELWAELIGKGIVFGRGDNPINFVSVEDVATSVERAVIDRSLRGRCIEVGGSEDLTFNELAALVQELTGAPRAIRHVPRWLLRLMAPLHRQPRAALVMDTTDMTFRPGDDEPIVAATPIRRVLAASTDAC